MTAPRIDSLQTGDRVVLRFPSGTAEATFILHNGQGEDRTATFSTQDAGIWDAYRHNKRWCYGTAQTPLKVLGRALPPPTLDFQPTGPVSHWILPPAEENPQPIEIDWDRQEPTREMVEKAFGGPDMPNEDELEEALLSAFRERSFNAPNPTCACGETATQLAYPDSDSEALRNLAVCETCYGELENT